MVEKGTEEIKATSVADYRKTYEKRLTLTLPSGAVFIGKPISLFDLAEIPKDIENKDWARYILPRCIIQPKIVDKPIESCGDNELSIFELTSEDQVHLVKEISEASKAIGESFLAKGEAPVS